jgi:hypothetical protein
VRRCRRPDLFTKIEQQAVALGAAKQRRDEAVLIICKLVVHTGRDVDQLTAEDVLAFRGWVQQLGRRHIGGGMQPNLAWDLLRGVADLAWRWETISYTSIVRLLQQNLTRAGLRDAAGQPLHYTPHDFRRIFATEAVTGGLPVHIVARLLGHANINTTQAYLAVFDEELVRSYRAFLDKRRAVRPEAEYREPTDEEWREFQQHFQTRKLELGECGRPYGTVCKHEHACIRCPSLRLDPRARPRLAEIIANLRDRIHEARLNGWLGEIQGLQVSLDAATRKLVSLDRLRDRQPAGPVNLGVPVIGDHW